MESRRNGPQLSSRHDDDDDDDDGEWVYSAAAVDSRSVNSVFTE